MPFVLKRDGYRFYKIGPYLSFTKDLEYKLSCDFGLHTNILDNGDDAHTLLFPYTGLYYGNKISIGFDLTIPILSGKVFVVCTPAIKFKI